MFTRMNSPTTDERLATPRTLNCCQSLGQWLNIGAIGILSAVSAMLFVQLQAVSLRVASEQSQIDELRS